MAPKEEPRWFDYAIGFVFALLILFVIVVAISSTYN